MNNEQLTQIKDLLKNNKRDRFVIFDNDEPALVVMSIDEYKKLARNSKGVNLEETDSDLVENINRTIAEWKSSQNEENLEDMEVTQDDNFSDVDDDIYDTEENLSYYYDMDDND